MMIKKGDNVKVMAGKDKGKTGKVTQSFPKAGKLVVEGVNVMYKHMRTRKQGQKGQKLEFSGPIAASNVQLVCPKCAKPTRIGSKSLTGDLKKKARICKKCKEVID